MVKQLKAIESPNAIDVASVTIEHPESSNKLSKIIRQGKKVSQVADADKNQNSSLCGDTTKSENVLNKKIHN